MADAGPYIRYMSAAEPLTADDLLHLHLGLPGKRTELVRGRLVVSEPPGYWHGRVTAELFMAVGFFAKDHNAGHVLASETGFKLRHDPDTVRAAHVSFVGRDRLPDPPLLGYAEMAPDLAVEVLSPSLPLGWERIARYARRCAGR